MKLNTKMPKNIGVKIGLIFLLSGIFLSPILFEKNDSIITFGGSLFGLGAAYLIPQILKDRGIFS